jgi:O-methyltransferase
MSNRMYISLLKKVLIDLHRIEFGEYRPLEESSPSWKFRILRSLDKLLRKKTYAICKYSKGDPSIRLQGGDWPYYADTMIGLKRLENIEYCVGEVLKDKIPGDFIETGVWRGGATIFMKALLKASNITDRRVWVADSFEGLPRPNEEKYAADKGDKLFSYKILAVSQEMVAKNFEKYDLLDDNVKFLKGWFKDTLPTAPIQQLAVVRLDGDLYESTMDGLVNLYPKLSKGGFIIIDDWGAVKACQQAVIDYREKHGITEEIFTIDWTGAYWRKEN